MKKTCIVTGASRGIGRAIAVSISEMEEVENIILLARSENGLKETREMIGPNKNVEYFPIDLTEYEQVRDIVHYVGTKYGTIDMLVNVAGYANPKSILETTIENWEKTYKINVHSVFHITRETVRFMKNTGGKILNVASTAGSTPRPGWLAYASSKAAIISISQTLSAELSDYGILVYCISPGRCATELRRILAPDEDPTTIMQPEEVGEVVKQLFSNPGLILDGQDIIVRKQPSTIKAQKSASIEVMKA